MLTARLTRATRTRRLAVPFCLALALLAGPALAQPDRALPDNEIPQPSITPLHLDELGPRTERVERGQFDRVVYVTPTLTARKSPTGESEAPWTSLADALDGIRDAGPSRRYAVFVAAGVYNCNGLALKPYVELYGGFDSRRWERDINRQPTILDGTESGPILLGADHARLDGFLIRNGRGTHPGGALQCRDSSPWISNNVFTANRTLAPAPNQPTGDDQRGTPGGAIACTGRASHPVIEKNTFAFNATTLGDGGAIACLEGARPRIQLNIFAGNLAGLTRLSAPGASNGGAIACESGAAADVFSNLIVNNAATNQSDGGALYADRAGTISIRRNIIAGNNAEGSGGGIMSGGQRDYVISGNIISSNLASDIGGGVCLDGGGAGLVENCLICENKASEGGGISASGVAIAIHNATICNNQGDHGGGVQVGGAGADRQAHLVNTVVGFNNSASDVYRDAATSMTLDHCITGETWAGPGNLSEDPLLANDYLIGQVATMEFNRLTYQTRLVLVARQIVKNNTLPGRVIRVGNKASVIATNRRLKEIDHQEVWVWGDMTGGGMNRAPVSFAVLPTYRPLPGSPCIDTGRNLGADLDLYGNTRPAFGRKKLATDIGAVEYIPLAPRGDVDLPATLPEDKP